MDAAAAHDLVTQVWTRLIDAPPQEAYIAPLARRVEHGATSEQVALRLLTSRPHVAENRTPEAFVTDLYHDVLNREPDAEGYAFWVGTLRQGRAGRAQVAQSFLNAGDFATTVNSYISNVTVNKSGWSTGTQGSYQANVAGFYNGSNAPATITINVTGPGTYTLNQSGGSYVGNNSGTTWRSYSMSIGGTAQPQFVSSYDASGKFSSPTVKTGSVVYGNGTVPSGYSTSSNAFQPVTTIKALAGGTIVITQSPGL